MLDPAAALAKAAAPGEAITYTIAFSNAGMLCEDGKCKTFDAGADGYVRGEGVGALLLKPLERAQADGDHIHALIRGSAENHGGHAASMISPNPRAQADVLVRAEGYGSGGDNRMPALDPGFCPGQDSLSLFDYSVMTLIFFYFTFVL